MWRITVIIFLLTSVLSGAQEKDASELIMRFLGAESPEEVGEDDAEMLASLLARPLRLNRVSLEQMLDSGLLDRYKAASLLDYRNRHGDVLSIFELSLVDGFSESFVRRLEPFISLESASPSGAQASEKSRMRAEMTLRSGARHNEGMLWMAGIRSKLHIGNRLTSSCAVTSPYGGFAPDEFMYSASLMLRCPGIHTKFIAGDFNARFGQGLAIWNGLSLSSLSSPSAFMKNPSGITQSFSFTGSNALSGIGAETSIRRFSVSAFLAFPGVRSFRFNEDDLKLLPAVNVSWYGRHGQLAATVLDGRSSLDTRWCINGTDIFGEIVYDWHNRSSASLAGVIFPVGAHLKSAAMLRYYPASFDAGYSGAMSSFSSSENQYGASLSAEFDMKGSHRMLSVLDAAHLPQHYKGDRGGSMQIKCLFLWEWNAIDWMTVKFRFTERYRSWGDPFRTDFRTDIQAMSGDFKINLRLNVLKCRNWGLLSYLEGGREGRILSLWLRHGFFRIDDWNDRIYVYERGALGGFRVPAYYGRGLWTALTLASRFSRSSRLYLRAAFTSYPFMHGEKRKPGKAELEIQYVCRF